MVVWWLGCIILFVLIIAIGFVAMEKTNDEDFSIDIMKVLLTISFVIILLCTFHSWFGSYEINTKYTYENKASVYSISNNINTNGSFILGCGTINSDLYYFIMVGDDEQGYTVQKYNAKDTYLIPEDVTPYYVEKHKISDMRSAQNFIYGGLFKPLKDVIGFDSVQKKELHLPKNYIKQNYNIDISKSN